MRKTCHLAIIKSRQFNPQNPLIVQSDKTILLEVESDRYLKARDALARFAEFEKSPEHIHTYRLTTLSLWNAAAAGLTAPIILDDPTRLVMRLKAWGR